MRNAPLLRLMARAKSRRGGTQIEYVMIAALVSVGIIAGLTAVASSVSDLWFMVSEKVVEKL